MGDRLEWFLGKGRVWAPWDSFPPTSIPLVSFGLSRQLLTSHLHPHALGRDSFWGLSGLAGLDRSPGQVLKFRVVHLTLLIMESMSTLVAPETLTCKCLRCLCYSNSNLNVSLRDGNIVRCGFIGFTTVNLFTRDGSGFSFTRSLF